jgi:LmbE family N-acetylglucosaminyl deacetylase
MLPAEALQRVTHLCVGAHQDDIEIMAHAGIAECFGQPGKAFGGVVVTDGAGSSRTGAFANMTDGLMQAVRRNEQRRAADLGRYIVQIQLGHPSEEVKQPNHPAVAEDLQSIFHVCRPEVLYLHNPADKHDTQVALFLRCIEALRTLPPEKRPLKVLGCEVWRDLDWLVDADKVALDSGRQPELASKLLEIFASQISGGKRYDLATLGRRAANATFHTSHAVDRLQGITWAMDLTPLVNDPKLNVADFTLAQVDRLRADVANRLGKFTGKSMS